MTRFFGKVRNAQLLLWVILRMQPRMIISRIRLEVFGLKPPRGAGSARRSNRPPWGCSAARHSARVSGDVFEYNSEVGSFRELGWSGPERDALWRFNQHYFAHLVAREAPNLVCEDYRLIREWADLNPPMAQPAWHPYTASIRAVNFVKWDWNYSEFLESEFHLLALHGEFISKNLELHLRGNHLITNAKALIFISAYLENSRSTEWASRGLKILRKELAEQILKDGGHAELSPMYHSLVLEDILDLLHLAALVPAHPIVQLRDLLIATAEKMHTWLVLMEHPSGDLASFNDTTAGIALSARKLGDYASGIGVSLEKLLPRRSYGPEGFHLTDLRESGFLVLQGYQEETPTKVVLDVGKIGLAYVPGHGHADTLSIEFSVGSHRVVRNGGVSTYHEPGRREYERGTTNHSTVSVDGRNSSQTIGSFRVGRSASGRLGQVDLSSDSLFVEGSHAGFSKLFKRVTHIRRVVLERNKLRIIDNVEGRHSHAFARFIFDESVKVTRLDSRTHELAVDDKTLVLRVLSGKSKSKQTLVARSFGHLKISHLIDIDLAEGEGETVIEW